jgi:hypothetical protein
MKKEDIAVTHPEKSTSKIGVNSFMMGSLFFILTFILAISPTKFDFIVIAELVLAIPILYFSSLVYIKLTYHKEKKFWDVWGWYTHHAGNLFVLNVVGMITVTFSRNLALAYFLVTILLTSTYSWMDYISNPVRIKKKIVRFLFLLIIILVGGVLPILLK